MPLIVPPGGAVDVGAVAEQAMAAGASQDYWELRTVLAMVAGLAPAVMVEIGCDAGGTLAAWRAVCGRVYGITLADNSPEVCGQGLPLDDHGATVHVGDSHDPASLGWLVRQLRDGRWSCVLDHRAEPCGDCDGCRWAQGQAAGTVDVLVIDGDHMAAGVLADLADYGPLVRPGGVILMHDICWTAQPGKVQVRQVWPGITQRLATTEIHNTSGAGPAQGWGVIWVQPGDEFSQAAAGDR